MEKTVGMKRFLLVKTCRIMTIIAVMLLGWYGSGLSGPLGKVETSPETAWSSARRGGAKLGLSMIPLLQDKWPVLAPVRPGERYSSVCWERGGPPAVALSSGGQTIISFHWGCTGAQMGSFPGSDVLTVSPPPLPPA